MLGNKHVEMHKGSRTVEEYDIQHFSAGTLREKEINFLAGYWDVIRLTIKRAMFCHGKTTWLMISTWQNCTALYLRVCNISNLTDETSLMLIICLSHFFSYSFVFRYSEDECVSMEDRAYHSLSRHSKCICCLCYWCCKRDWGGVLMLVAADV